MLIPVILLGIWVVISFIWLAFLSIGKANDRWVDNVSGRECDLRGKLDALADAVGYEIKGGPDEYIAIKKKRSR